MRMSKRPFLFAMLFLGFGIAVISFLVIRDPPLVIQFSNNQTPYEFVLNASEKEIRVACVGCDLMDVDLHRGNLRKADLSQASLQNARLTNANLYYVNFTSANLTNADLSHTNMEGVNLADADLSGASLLGARLRKAKMDNANFSGAIWVNGSKCNEGSFGRCDQQ